MDSALTYDDGYGPLAFDVDDHHLAKRVVYPGRPVVEMFNALIAPENFPVFAVVSFTIMAFRTIGVILARK